MKLSPQQKREIVAAAQCTEKTLKRWLDKKPMKPTVKARIDAAWKKVKERAA